MRFCILFLTCLRLVGQTGLQFEVASIKPSGPRSERGSDGGPGSHDPIRYVFGRATLKDLILPPWNSAGLSGIQCGVTGAYSV